MLEHVPRWLGQAMGGLRAGADKLVIARSDIGDFGAVRLASPAFANGARLPDRFTQDGAGVSPPLFWTGIPEAAVRIALIVEDADAPAPKPLVHAVIWNLPGDDGDLKEGEIRADPKEVAPPVDVGRNSYFGEGWLPPDPPTGHGVHHYAFQLFALADGPSPVASPGRSSLVKAMAGRVIAAGQLMGTYSRGEAAMSGPVASRLAVASRR